jgi:Ran GTPase-activating protein (RanGAP) involved in mRNA processing and transport
MKKLISNNKLNSDIFISILRTIPAEDWINYADITTKLSMVSKKMREAINNNKLPFVIKINRKWYNKNCNQQIKIINNLKKMSTLCFIFKLDLSHCHIKTENLISFIEHCPNVIYLNLSGNYIGQTLSNNLEIILTRCLKLQHLNLSHNYIEGYYFRNKIEKPVILDNIKYTIKFIDLSYNFIGNSISNNLIPMLSKCCDLEYIDLSYNNIGQTILKKLSILFTQYPKLYYLNLNFNFVGDSGLEYITNVLGQYKALTHLHLKNNYIEKTGFNNIIKVLKYHKDLKILHIDLIDNNIGDDDKKILAEILKKN